MSIISQIEDEIGWRLKAVSCENGYRANIRQVVFPKRHDDWQKLSHSVVVDSGNEQLAPAYDRSGNPPAIGKLLPVKVSCLVIPSKLDSRSWNHVASDFAEDCQYAIVSVADWHKFGDIAVDATVTPINFVEPDDDSPGVARFTVNVIYRVSETNPTQLRS